MLEQGLTQTTLTDLKLKKEHAMAPGFYEPPRTPPLSPLLGLLRTLWRGDGDLLSLMPATAYRVPIGPLGYSRRSILILNDPDLYRGILTDPTDIFPKNDLMTGALGPLVGDSLFVSSGPLWRRQRTMIDPAFSQLRVTQAFAGMQNAVDAYSETLARRARDGETFSLDFAMSELTADVICRTIFSTSLASETAQSVFSAFAVFERSAAHIELGRLIFSKPFSAIPQHAEVLEACEIIRAQLGTLVDARRALPEGAWPDDIASAVMRARDPESGAPFTRKELIDQLGVFFLAGHETTASALIWVFFILSQRPEFLKLLREEVEKTYGDEPIDFARLRSLAYTRAVFREAMRLYPPITFIPRVAAETTRLGPYRVKRGAMLMVSPWVIHRHEQHWPNPHRFDPGRFFGAAEKTHRPGTYLPFGLGPRVCVGADFATIEASLIMATLLRRFDFEILAPEAVRPVARLTTRPREEIQARVHLRPGRPA